MKAVPLTGIAKRVHDDVLSLDPEAAVLYAQMVVAGALAHDLETHADMINHRVNEIVAKRVAVLKEGLVRSYVSKRVGGDEVEHLVRVAEVIAKAGFENITADQRRRWASEQDRDRLGRFKTENRKIRYTGAKKIPGRAAKPLGVPDDAQRLSGQDRARYQHAYLQVADMVRQYADVPGGAGQLSLLYRLPGGGTERVTRPLPDLQTLAARNTDGANAILDHTRFRQGGVLTDATVIVDGDSTPAAGIFNLVGALGSPYAAGRAAESFRPGEVPGTFPGADRLGSFADDWADTGTKPTLGDRVFRRIKVGSEMLNDLAGPNAPSQVKMAVELGRWTSQYGPEAQKVIGPHADRAAYRYRGVERPPHAGLQREIDAIKARNAPEDARTKLLYGEHRDVATRAGVRQDFLESPIVAYFKEQRLPKQELTHLQLKSGVVAPSEGIIIDRNGKVVTQAVGYGDDWYLPFNLKTLSKLKGGDYVRTRTWGGPTTEDVYAGLISGARSVTVVSHNGTYVVEFDDAFRGSRRYNDKAARMVKRYGHLLDAAKSGQVTADIPPERLKELRDEAAFEFDPKRRDEAEKFRARFKELREAEAQNPTMPEALKDQVVESVLNDYADKVKTDNGYAGDWRAVVADRVNRQVDESRKFHDTFAPELGFNEEDARATAGAKYATPAKAAAALGLQKQVEDALERAEADYQAKYSPLRLDGEGYYQSLQALREQFPYYIARVDYRPNARGGADLGYVKPKFNRPAAALSGYFDPSITGSGKVGADETRHQNRGVDNAARFAERRARTQQATAPAAAGGASTAATARTNPDADLEAMLALRARLRGADVTFEGRSLPVADRRVREQLDTNLPWLFRMDDDAFLAEARRDKANAKEKLLADLRTYVDRGFGQVTPDEMDQIRNPERAARGAAWDMLTVLTNPNRSYDLGPEVAPGRREDQYQRTAVQALRQIRLADDVDDAGLDQYIEQQARFYRAAQREAGDFRRADAARFEANIKAAVTAKQARRRAAEAAAEAREAERLRQQALLDASDQVVIDEADNPEAAARLRRPNPRVISSTVEDDDRR